MSINKYSITGLVFKHSLLVFIVIWLINGCATNPVSGKRNFVTMSEQQEIQLGRQLNQQYLAQSTVYDDSKLQAYVSRIGDELARKSHRNNLVFHFTVLDDPMVNAFALPGGYIYITRGILAYMNSEAHLAGVLGHEIGHVTARHSVRQQAQSSVAGILGAVAGIATGSREVAQLSNTLGSALVSGYGRKHELEADRLGAEYIAGTGYDPDDMIGVIGILKDQEDFAVARARAEGREPRTYHGTFSTHPRNDQRLQEVINAAKRLETSVTRNENRDDFLRYLENMTFGDSEAQGILRGNQFYHGPLDLYISFPEGWRVQNEPNRLLAVAPNNETFMQMTAQDKNQQESLRQFMRRQFQGLRNERNSSSRDFPVFSGVANIDTPFGKQPARVAAVSHAKKIYIFVSASKQGLIGNEFLNTVESVRSLRANEKDLARARHIELIRVRNGDTFAKLARRSVLTNYAEDQLRLINGMYPDGEPTVGQLIKIIR